MKKAVCQKTYTYLVFALVLIAAGISTASMAERSDRPLSPRENEISSFWQTVIGQLKETDIAQLDRIASRNEDRDPQPIIVSINLIYDKGKLRLISERDKSLEFNHYMTLSFEKNFENHKWSIVALDDQHFYRKSFLYSDGIDIRYIYDDDFFDGYIAKSAKAYQNGFMLAEAHAIRRIETTTPYQIEVQETQYDKNNKKVCTGILTISLSPIGEVTRESATFGEKVSQVFSTWATGRSYY